ncbi:hypothetical protein [Undibacterium flavidum]|uniref:Lipoprotein n=1 Tax=Undibacterium flavidum TaxID=2762297 RepID=A0ABR6YBT8_9BURK|nr:hypothetical protein [Undibacterium flavidum]MBC3873624.1 hypothetical protein [Undibacterium flavidum]
MKKVAILISVLLSACATNNNSDQMAYDKALALAKQQSTENRGNPLYKEHFSIWNKYNNENKIDTKDGCYKYGKEPVKFILIQNGDGVIENIITKSDDKKTNCFVKSY